MYNYKIKTSFVSPEIPKARANNTSFNIQDCTFLYLQKTGYNAIRYMNFQYGLEQVLIHAAVINQFLNHTRKKPTKNKCFSPDTHFKVLVVV